MIPAPGKLRQGDCEFKTSLDYIVRQRTTGRDTKCPGCPKKPMEDVEMEPVAKALLLIHPTLDGKKTVCFQSMSVVQTPRAALRATARNLCSENQNTKSVVALGSAKTLSK